MSSSEDRIQAILAEALRSWTAYNYHAVPLRQIALRAGVSLALIHHHFGAKHGLLAALVAPIEAQVEASCAKRGPASENDRGAELPAMAAAVVGCGLAVHRQPQGRERMALWLAHCSDQTPEVRVHLRRVIEPLHQLLRQLCKPAWLLAEPDLMWPLLSTALGICAAVQAEPLAAAESFNSGRASALHGLVEALLRCRLAALGDAWPR